MPFRVPLCIPFRFLIRSGARFPGGARCRSGARFRSAAHFRSAARSLRRARLRHRRPAVLLLLVAGLLSVVLPCADGADGHHDVAVPAAVSSGRSAPVAAAPAQATAGATAGHHDSACVPGPAGHLPQGRTATGAEGAAVPALLAGAVYVAAGRRPAAGTGAARRRPARSGRSTLAALCRCRI
ncbi:hypothetical protein [Streptomyces sp. NPDC048637]|uniref:hypothetical protein n=1 Tax=Streptomyces sp. NPDC048637 TaxID=3155636 RepID=UPI00343A11C8